MKRLLRRILAWLSQPDLSSSGGQTFLVPEWQPTHQAQLAAFLGSDTGRVVMARGRAVLANTAITACHDTFSTQHSAARAAGFSDALKWLESLSRSSRAPDDSWQERPTAGNTTDTSPLGETELRERMSP
jgi:hypothetical protein